MYSLLHEDLGTHLLRRVGGKCRGSHDAPGRTVRAGAVVTDVRKYMGRTAHRVGLSWYVLDGAKWGRWIGASWAEAKRWIRAHPPEAAS